MSATVGRLLTRAVCAVDLSAQHGGFIGFEYLNIFCSTQTHTHTRIPFRERSAKTRFKLGVLFPHSVPLFFSPSDGGEVNGRAERRFSIGASLILEGEQQEAQSVRLHRDRKDTEETQDKNPSPPLSPAKECYDVVVVSTLFLLLLLLIVVVVAAHLLFHFCFWHLHSLPPGYPKQKAKQKR